jgi:hypothetical protein
MHTLITSNKDKILSIAAHHGVKDIRVFGSMARGDAVESSDIDFLIEAGDNTTPWFPGGLQIDLQRLLGRKVDIVEVQALKGTARERVLREAEPI